jgi:SpoVK/Ycf46/Vps4 family AAA+-type ATPase
LNTNHETTTSTRDRHPARSVLRRPRRAGRLQGWADKAKELLAGPPKLRPRALLLAGLPGTGKGTCTRGLARHLDLAVWHLDAATDTAHLGEALEVVRQSEPSVLWIDGLNPRCRALARWLSLHDETPGLVVVTTDEPYRLPASMLRAGVFDEAFHLDLPDSAARAVA